MPSIYLTKQGKTREAAEQLDILDTGETRSPNDEYNLGLVYFALRKYDQSLLHAQKAYQAGFPLPGLRRKLSSVGKWSPLPELEAKTDEEDVNTGTVVTGALQGEDGGKAPARPGAGSARP